MTEAELLEVAQIGWGNVISLLAVFLTVLSGYLIVAYVAGASMIRQQVIIINMLYILMGGMVLAAMFTMSVRATEWATLSVEVSVQRVNAPADWTAFGVTAACVVSMLASLKFMWDVRHPKTN